MTFKKMTRTTVFEETIESIKRSILSQELKPGDRLPSEGKMADMMGVGRGTVREALQVLIHLGLLTRANKVTSVAPYALDRLTAHSVFEKFQEHHDLMEMIELRKIVEPEASALAAERISAQGLEQVELQFEEMLGNRGDIERFADFDHAFHTSVLEASGNSLIVELLKRIQEPMRRSQALMLHASGEILPRSLGFHEKILAALRSRDRLLARKHMLNHILDIEREMYAIVSVDHGSQSRAAQISP